MQHNMNSRIAEDYIWATVLYYVVLQRTFAITIEPTKVLPVACSSTGTVENKYGKVVIHWAQIKSSFSTSS